MGEGSHMRFPHSHVRCGRSISQPTRFPAPFWIMGNPRRKRQSATWLLSKILLTLLIPSVCYHHPPGDRMTDNNQSRIRFECINPILRVENMQSSLEFYVNALGFE